MSLNLTQLLFAVPVAIILYLYLSILQISVSSIVENRNPALANNKYYTVTNVVFVTMKFIISILISLELSKL